MTSIRSFSVLFSCFWGIGLCPLAFATIVHPATSGPMGLADATEFRLTTGNCRDCPTPPAALWYFRDETIAVPHVAAESFDAGLRVQEDVRRWAAARNGKQGGTKPPLIWLGSPEVARGILSDQGNLLESSNEKPLRISMTPRIASNRSYFNELSARYFTGRPLKVRGRMGDDGFIARTLWPDDFALADAPRRELKAGETLDSLVRADTKPTSFGGHVLWTRDGKPTRLEGKPVLAFVLNGAQGDDDEAHGGHFAVATGRFGPRGEWSDLLVNNFYNLDSVSEKGIVAATLPMDAYQADLNSGQSWYRPSYLLFAVFRQDRVPALYQEAIGRVFNHFYRHSFRYDHANANCAGISMETLRSLGWTIPKQGPASRLKAIAALPYMAIKDGELESGRKAFDYLSAETTNLYPFVAFTAVGEDLLNRVIVGIPSPTPFEQAMAEDIEALVYVRIPQFPSSRAFGQAPVASLDEYMARAPADRSKWEIVPVPPRPFPADLKDPSAPEDELRQSSVALAGFVGFLGVLGIGGWRVRQRYRKDQK